MQQDPAMPPQQVGYLQTFENDAMGAGNYVETEAEKAMDSAGTFIAQKKSNTLSEAEFIETAKEEKTKLFRRIMIFAALAAITSVGTFLIFWPVMKLTGNNS